MLPSVSRIGGNGSSATAMMASTTLEASPITLKLPAAHARRSSPTGVSSYAGNGSALTSPAPKFVPVGPGSTAQMRKTGADQRDRADEVGVDLLLDLIVGKLLRCAEQAVAGVTDQHVHATEIGE